MLMLKKVKWCKSYCGCWVGKVKGGDMFVFGDYGLQVFDVGWIIFCQIEFVCIVIICYIKRSGKVWICIFLDKLVSKKLFEICMGKGKGNLEFWVVLVKLGWIFYEFEGVDFVFVKEVMCFVGYKFGICICFVV